MIFVVNFGKENFHLVHICFTKGQGPKKIFSILIILKRQRCLKFYADSEYVCFVTSRFALKTCLNSTPFYKRKLTIPSFYLLERASVSLCKKYYFSSKYKNFASVFYLKKPIHCFSLWLFRISIRTDRNDFYVTM